MSTHPLFDHDKAIQPLFWAVLVNRMQIVYFILILPGVLVYPYMLWVILIVGCLASLNILLIGKCLAIDSFRDFMGSLWMRLLMIPCIVILLLKITIIIKGYAGIVHQILFPSITTGTIIVFLLIASFYLAKKGIWTVLSFSMIAFLGSAWILIVFAMFLFSPEANYSHLYPLISFSLPDNFVESLIFIWSAFAGPEYFIVLGPWSGGKRVTKYLLAGHAFSIMEYMYLFVVSLVFFGSSYLKKIEYPIVHLLRYIQFPFFERVEMIMVPAYMISNILFISLFMLYLYGLVRILLHRTEKPVQVKGLFMISIVVLGYLMIVDRWFWSTENQRRVWEQLQLFVGGASFLFIPALFLVIYTILYRRKRIETIR